MLFSQLFAMVVPLFNGGIADLDAHDDESTLFIQQKQRSTIEIDEDGILLAHSTECPPLSKDGRCGPSYGGTYCSRVMNAEWRYCSSDSHCGITSSHQNGQTRYDESNLPEGCNRAPEPITEECAWRQTGECSPYGPRESQFDIHCDQRLDEGASGYCDCNGNGDWDRSNEPGYSCTQSKPSSCSQRCPALPAPVLSDAPHHALQLAENSLGVAGGIMRFDDIMEDSTQLVIENVTEYTPFNPNVTGLTAPNSSMAQISLGCGDKVEMVFSFLLASEPKEMDIFDFTVADLDKGAHERCAEMVEVVGYTNYSLYPSSSVQVEPGTPFLFIGTAAGSSADNPEDIETMTDEQKSKAVSFVIEKREAFTVLFSTTEPGVSSDDPDVVGYNGRRILFGFGTP